MKIGPLSAREDYQGSRGWYPISSMKVPSYAARVASGAATDQA